MYDKYYGLSEKPFQLTPDERYFFSSKSKSKDLDYLEYALGTAEGIVLVTGETGSGKTALIQHLITQLNADRVTAGWIATTCVDANDILYQVASAFDIPCEEPGLNNTILLRRIAAFIHHCGTEGKTACLIVEDAQRLSDAALEELRLLSSYRGRPAALVQIVLLGKPELRRRLLQGPFEQLRQHVIASYHLLAFDVFDTREYIAHRLQMAGWKGEPSFTEGALRRIYAETCGIAGQINLVCDRLLLWGGLLKKRQLEAGDVHDVIRDLREKSLYVTARGTNDRSVGIVGQKLAPIGVVEDSHERSLADANSEDATDQTDVKLSGVGAPSEDLSAPHEKALSTEDPLSPSLPETDDTRVADHTRARELLSRMPLAQLPGSSRDPAFRADAGTGPNTKPPDFGTNGDAFTVAKVGDGAKAGILLQRGRGLAIRAFLGLAILAGLFFLVDSLLGGREGTRPLPPVGAGVTSLDEGTSQTADTAARPITDTLDAQAEHETVTPKDAWVAFEVREHTVDTPSWKQTRAPSEAQAGISREGADAAVPTGTPEVPEIEPVQSEPPVSDLDAVREQSVGVNPAVTPSVSLRQVVADDPASPETTSDRGGKDAKKPSLEGRRTVPDSDIIEYERQNENNQDVADSAALNHGAPVNPSMSTVEPDFEPAAANEGAESLARAHLTSGVRSREPVDTLVSPISAAQLPGGQLFYFTEVIGLSGRSIQHRWEYEGRVVSTVRFSIGSDRWRVYSAKTIGNNAGSWRVVVVDGRGNVLKSTPFLVE